MDGHPDSLFVMDMNPQLCVTSQLMTHFEYDCMIEVGQQVLSFENVATTQEGPPAVKQWTELEQGTEKGGQDIGGQKHSTVPARVQPLGNAITCTNQRIGLLVAAHLPDTMGVCGPYKSPATSH